MLKRTVLSLPLLPLTMTPESGFAQSQDAGKTVEPQKFYKLEFVVKEVEGGKVLNARTYSTTVLADAKDSGSTSIRAGGGVPYQTTTTMADSKTLQSFQYFEIGVNIDCRAVKEVERGLSLYVSASISSVTSDPAAPTAASTAPPTVRQNTWSSVTIMPLKKPTVIFSSDDPASKRQMQLELTATPIP
jgi:hypothetical protein